MSNVSLIDGHIDEMTDNDIIKALECCLDTSPLTCKNCPLFNVKNSTMVCSKSVTKFALDLINRQQTEIERLTKETMNMAATIESCQSEAIKWFAERLKEEISIRPTHSNEQNKYVCFLIDNLVKEMVGEEK